MDKTKLIELFASFAKQYDFDDPIIALKFNHSLQTASYCMEIASSLALSQQEQLVAFAIGLLHEVGTFDSWKQTKTYPNIPLTIKLLFKDNLIEKYGIPKQYYKAIEFAIAQHKNHEIEQEPIKKYSEKFKNSTQVYRETILFCKILKDANTIEFFGMLKRKVLPSISTSFSKTSLSQSVMKSFRAESKVDLPEVKSKLDQIVFNLSLYYALYFDYSFQFCKKISFSSAILDFYKPELSQKEFVTLQKIVTAFEKKEKIKSLS